MRIYKRKIISEKKKTQFLPRKKIKFKEKRKKENLQLRKKKYSRGKEIKQVLVNALDREKM